MKLGITEEKKLKLRFYLDDLSREGGNFCSLGTWGGYQPGGYINGENVIVKLSEDGYPPTENTRLSYKFNSCFADVIEPNDDGTDTYTVKVANGRHLQNLNFCGEGYGGLKITRVIQTDNILWQEDDSITSQTEAYCKEVKDAYRRDDDLQSGKFQVMKVEVSGRLTTRTLSLMMRRWMRKKKQNWVNVIRLQA